MRRERSEYAEQVHAEFGDCLLGDPGGACFCGLRREDGSEDLIALAAIRQRLGIGEPNADK